MSWVTKYKHLALLVAKHKKASDMKKKFGREVELELNRINVKR
jgi:hypothetical protein